MEDERDAQSDSRRGPTRAREEQLERPDGRGTLPRRRLLAGSLFGLGFLTLPFGRGVRGSAIPAGAIRLPDQQFFDSCSQGGVQYGQYSDGTDCGEHDCSDDFYCQGGTWDDFECVRQFACGTADGSHQFRCAWSFDGEDCQGSYACHWFNCEAGYGADPV